MLAESAMLLANNNHGVPYLVPLDNLVISPTSLLDVACPRFVTLAIRPAHEYTLVSGGDFIDAGVPYGGTSHPNAAQTAPVGGTSVPRCNYLFHLLVTPPCWVVACPSLEGPLLSHWPPQQGQQSPQ